MSEYDQYIGVGVNPEGPDLPLGLGMQLAQEPRAVEAYGKLTNTEKEAVIRYIQSGATGAEAKNRIALAVNALKDNRKDIFFN